MLLIYLLLQSPNFFFFTKRLKYKTAIFSVIVTFVKIIKDLRPFDHKSNAKVNTKTNTACSLYYLNLNHVIDYDNVTIIHKQPHNLKTKTLVYIFFVIYVMLDYSIFNCESFCLVKCILKL